MFSPSWASAFFYAAFPVFAMDRLGWNSLQLGTFFTYLSLMMIVVQGPVLGCLSRFFTEAALVAIGSLLLVLCFFGMASTQPAQIYAATTLYALGNGLMWPSFLSLLSRHGSEEVKGSIQGYANAVGSLASILGLMVGGFLFARLGEATFYLASGVLSLVFIFALSLGNFWPGMRPSASTSH
ncbi:MAG: MFS transporter [Microscillaceae bacterium]|nr:MFS transporter [Microscillaceae bacterium]